MYTTVNSVPACDIRKSLEYLMLLKLKNGEVKIEGRRRAYGRNQRHLISKEDT